MMTFSARAASIFGYNVFATSLLVFTTYLVISILSTVTDKLPGIPKPDQQGGLNLKEAFTDLYHITAYPHPHNSHANDRVHDYILSRLEEIASKHPHVHVVNDIISNKTWYSRELGGSHGEYFEGSNILVKVDGTSGATRGGVLFSAHYDSVSTARGATDDGMGVVTLIQLVKLFATQRQPRTAVFNINNGEEDGLHGAVTFLEHPWSKLADTFLNLEGAAAGGQPILFRATSETAMKSLANSKLVRHPHANVISSDAFSRGLIKSGTDFSVYSGQGKMDGLDLAFYKGRSKYHTKYDSVQYTVGGEKSLWSMMESARGIGIGLLTAHGSRGEENDDAVFFDVFKSRLVLFGQKALLIFNIALLILGPLCLLLLIFCETIILEASNWNKYIPARFYNGRLASPSRSPSRHSLPGEEISVTDERPTVQDANNRLSFDFNLICSIWRHTKFWIALGIVIALQIGLLRTFVRFNAFAIYSSPYIILLSCVSLAYLTLIYVLTIPSSLPFFDSARFRNQCTLLPAPQQEKQTLFFHLYGFTWLLLVVGTVGITRVQPGVGGGYLFSVWNACVTVACIFVGIEGLLTPGNLQKSAVEPQADDELSGEESHIEEEEELPQNPRYNGEGPNEETPLIWRAGREGNITRRIPSSDSESDDHEELNDNESDKRTTGWWIIQFLVSVPIPVLLFGQVTALLLDSVPQTLSDGGVPWLVYALTCIPAVLLILPLAPFAARLQPCYRLSLFIFAVFIITTLYALLAFPFSINSPLKIFFRQSVGFPGKEPAHLNSMPTIITELTGAKAYLPTLLIPALPSAQGKHVNCTEEKFRPGLVTCRWETFLMPSPGSDPASLTRWSAGQFFEAHSLSTGANSGRVRVRARNSRACRLYFDSAPVHTYSIQHTNLGGALLQKAARTPPPVSFVQHDAPPGASSPNIRELRLSTRDWERELAVDFSWVPEANVTKGVRPALHGRVACQWAEYESGMVDTGISTISNSMAFQKRLNIENGAKIPALEEALAYLPDWAVLTKYTDGLAEVWAPFTV